LANLREGGEAAQYGGLARASTPGGDESSYCRIPFTSKTR